MQRDPRAGNRRRARSAIGLDDVTVEGDLTFAKRLEIYDRAQTASDQALDLDRASVLLAGGCLAARAFERGARQHAVFGGDPAARLPLEPRRQAVLERCRHQDMGVAEPDETGPFREFHHAALK